jgi:hypothetical protein
MLVSSLHSGDISGRMKVVACAGERLEFERVHGNSLLLLFSCSTDEMGSLVEFIQGIDVRGTCLVCITTT